MKTMEQLLLHHLRSQVCLDQLQFAYQDRVGVEDAIVYIMHCFLSHLDRRSMAVRNTFLDLSNSFNTIQPQLS